MENKFEFTELNERLKDNSIKVESALNDFFSGREYGNELALIADAQKYSLLGGGKRIRPFLVNEVCRALGGDEAASMPFAIAVEMIHTYSLIHDDLPCMDDDDMRRGKASNHKVYGEANALLAGDALLTNAFLAASANREVSSDICVEAISMISQAAGDLGMIGGQILDLEGEGRTLSFEELLLVHSFKTGKLIELSVALGALSADFDRNSREMRSLCSYARKIGVVFQAIDDVLDVTGDIAKLGKPIASDKDNAKNTFLSFFDIEGTKKYAKDLTNEAISEISWIPNTDILKDLALYLLNRDA